MTEPSASADCRHWYGIGDAPGRALFGQDGKVEATVDHCLAYGTIDNCTYSCMWTEYVSTRNGGASGTVTGGDFESVRAAAMVAAEQAVDEAKASKAND